MKKILSLLCIGLVAACSTYTKNDNDKLWRIGAKIHFAEDSGSDYLGLKAINKITKDVLKSALGIQNDSAADNAKIMLRKAGDELVMTHYEEKSRPGIGEELHATLLYTSPRGFHPSETLHQVCASLFENCKIPPTIESAAKKYSTIIKSSWRLKISEIVLTKNDRGPSFIMAKLLFNEQETLYSGGKPISAGLHMALINCADSSILSDPMISNKLVKKLNQQLQGKMIKIAERNGLADLEFGLSGQSWRLRAGEKIELKG